MLNVLTVVTFGLLLFVPFIFLYGWVLMLIAGALLPTFGVATLSFWQSVGVVAIAKILFTQSVRVGSNG